MNSRPMSDVETGLMAHTRYLSRLIRSGGGTVVDQDGVVACVAVHEFPFLVNAVFRTDAATPPARVLDVAAEAFGAERGFEICVLPGRDDDLVDECVERGLAPPDDTSPIQVTDTPVSVPSAPEGFDLRWVRDGRGVADIAAVAEAAHRVYGFPEGLFTALFARPETVLGPDLQAAVVYRAGEPVATAQVHTVDDVTYVGWVAVLPDAGRKGLGTLVTAHVTNAGFDAGATRAVLMASPMGAAVYRRMGYRDVGGVAGVLVAPGMLKAGAAA